jgi:hypothetical protein
MTEKTEMRLAQLVANVKSKNDLSAFVVALRDDLRMNPDEWENLSLDEFLSAMADWVEAMEQYYRNTGRSMPESPTWQMFADILYASKIYE